MKFNVVAGSLTHRKEPILLGMTEGAVLPPWAAGWSAPIKKAVGI